MHSEKAAEKQKAGMVSAAFVGWQLGAGKEGQSFNAYLKYMGLVEKSQKMTKAEKEHTVVRAKHADEVCRKWFNENVKR